MNRRDTGGYAQGKGNLTITAESIYHWGLVSHDGGGELTRLVAIQAGVAVSH